MIKRPCATPILPLALLWKVLAGPAYRLSLGAPSSKWGSLYPLALFSGGIDWIVTLGIDEQGNGEMLKWRRIWWLGFGSFFTMCGLLFFGRVATFCSAELLYNGW
jgi:hypothetical protein